MIPFLAVLTTVINVFLITLLAAAPFLMRRGTNMLEYWLRSGLGIGISILLAESGKRFEVWPGHPSFPSGHETLALAVGVCLAMHDRRWLWLTLPLAVLQAWALVTGHFHQPVDVAGALVTGIVPSLICHQVSKLPQTS